MDLRPVVRAGPLGFYASCGIAGAFRDTAGEAHRDLAVLAGAVHDAADAGCLFTFLTHAFRVGYGDGRIADVPGPVARADLARLRGRVAWHG